MSNSLWPEGLPLPVMVNEIDYEAFLAARITRAVESFAAQELTYDVEALETDPAVILLQAATYEELLMRQRLNEAVRGQFLPFATGTDIDYLGGFHKLSRMVGESDDRYLTRIVLKTSAGDLGGSEPHYKLIAMTADLRVADAKPYRIGRDPTIHVAIISTDNNGVPDAELLAVVDAALQSPAARLTNDTILVGPAARAVTDVHARVWLLPDATITVIEEMRAQLIEAWSEIMLLGRDVNDTWLKAKLYHAGVHRIEIVSPASDKQVPFTEVAVLGEVNLELVGRDF